MYKNWSRNKKEEEDGALQTVFEDGKLLIFQTLDEIRSRLKNNS